MSEKKQLNQEELEKVSGGIKADAPSDISEDPLIDKPNHGNKKEYVVEYKELETKPNELVQLKIHYIGWYDTDSSAQNAGKHWCTQNSKRYLGVRLANKGENRNI